MSKKNHKKQKGGILGDVNGFMMNNQKIIGAGLIITIVALIVATLIIGKGSGGDSSEKNVPQQVGTQIPGEDSGQAQIVASPTPKPVEAATVLVTFTGPVPQEARVKVGWPVNILNTSTDTIVVKSTSEDGLIKSSGLAVGDEIDITFDKPGVYTYSTGEGTTFQGKIIVE